MNLLHVIKALHGYTEFLTIAAAVVWAMENFHDLGYRIPRLVTLISFACFVITGTIAAGMS